MAVRDFERGLEAVRSKQVEHEPALTDRLSAIFADAARGAASALTAAADWPLPDADEVWRADAVQQNLIDAMNASHDDIDQAMVSSLVGAPPTEYDTARLADAVTNHLRQDVQGILVDGWNNGLTASDVATQLEAVGQSSAPMIARTSLNAIGNAVSLNGARYSQVRTKTWSTQGDDRVRDSHDELDGVTIPVDEVFDNGCRFPADPNAAPEEVFNCRCWLEYDTGDAGGPPDGEQALPPMALTPTNPITDMIPRFYRSARSVRAAASEKDAMIGRLSRTLDEDRGWRAFDPVKMNTPSRDLLHGRHEWDNPAGTEGTVRAGAENWAKTASGDSLFSHRLQDAAGERFGVVRNQEYLDAAEAANGGQPIWSGVPDWAHDGMQRLANAQYNTSQAAAGGDEGDQTTPDEIEVWRAMALGVNAQQFGLLFPGETVSAVVHTNSLSSWSLAHDVGSEVADDAAKHAAEYGEAFAMYLVHGYLPITRLYAMPHGGFQNVLTHEVVVLGGRDPLHISLL